MSSKPSHIPIFPDAYLRDNYRLSVEQHGLFFLLIMESWNSDDCSLPDDEKALAEIAGITVPKFRKIAGPVLERWTREGGRIWQKRLRKEWEYVREKSSKRKAAAKVRWDQKDVSKCNASAMHLGEGEGEGEGASTKLVAGDNVKGDAPFRVVGGKQ